MELLMQRHRNGERQNELGSFVYIGDMRSYSAWEKAFEELSLDNKPYEEIRSWITEERLDMGWRWRGREGVADVRVLRSGRVGEDGGGGTPNSAKRGLGIRENWRDGITRNKPE